MKILLLIILMFTLSISLYADFDKKKLVTIKSTTSSNIDLKSEEKGYAPWYWHMSKIGNTFSTSFLSSQGKNSYKISNINDFNLNTAWVEGVDGFGIGQSFSFNINPKMTMSRCSVSVK